MFARVEVDLLRYIRPGQPVTCDQLVAVTGCSRMTVRRRLNALVEAGVLEAPARRARGLLAHYRIATGSRPAIVREPLMAAFYGPAQTNFRP
ncbi:hypothetical protein PIN31009_05559 [Pandoraea iniqua]|uniref:helix-turn-helix domain-containing protein n=1 Tax=Pandoraea iniqua TaxID=2508288 RepID=UPI0012415252|nr:helix-turn-helix domain-containing protein [Pandoraea iniqua]VVE59500.1 hypothetical protein PIN31009_05559 [Pandoraea iniqua]